MEKELLDSESILGSKSTLAGVLEYVSSELTFSCDMSILCERKHFTY